jgi:hypothetical protein
MRRLLSLCFGIVVCAAFVRAASARLLDGWASMLHELRAIPFESLSHSEWLTLMGCLAWALGASLYTNYLIGKARGKASDLLKRAT